MSDINAELEEVKQVILSAAKESGLDPTAISNITVVTPSAIVSAMFPCITVCGHLRDVVETLRASRTYEEFAEACRNDPRFTVTERA